VRVGIAAGIVAYANRFDPQTLHTNPEAAKRGPFGGLNASGWHTAGLMTRLFMDHYHGAWAHANAQGWGLCSGIE
jgi:acyl dehydratase